MKIFDKIFASSIVYFSYRCIQRLRISIVEARCKKTFKSFGEGSHILNPIWIQGPENILIGEQVQIHNCVWLASMPLSSDFQESILSVGNQCHIGDYCHIFAVHKIIIEEDVLIANHVYISDNLHSYEDIKSPIWKQPVKYKRDVVIGRDSWIGENVSIIGANVGKHCIIGANSVVTHDIPDYSVAVGSPARIVKRYNFNVQKWQRTNDDGTFKG